MIDRIRMPQMELPGPPSGVHRPDRSLVVVQTPIPPSGGESSSSAHIRIGVVSYLNSKPLIEGLAELVPDARIVLDLPSRLADSLARGQLHIALIPSIEAFTDPDYEIVSNACVATRGPVLSVKLYSRVHPGRIRMLALDEGSRTSAALVRLILAERYGVHPQLQPLPIDQNVSDSAADAVLLIGDRAMHPPAESFHTTWDLGEFWSDWTGLPFVFAMWVSRSGCDLGRVEAAVSQARDDGLRQLTNIAAREAPQLGISHRLAADYLKRNLYFRLGSAEEAGLQLFHELAAANGLAPDTSLTFRRQPPKTVRHRPPIAV